MLALRTLFYLLLKFPIRLLVHCKIVPDNLIQANNFKEEQPIFYVVRHQSASDLLALQKACKQKKLPDPLGKVTINGMQFSRLF